MPAKTSKERIGELLKTTLLELQKMGGEARVRELYAQAEPKLGLSAYEKQPYEKTGYIRWESILHFYSIDCVKAGYLQKSNGRWMLTPQGAEALKLAPLDFITTAQAKYRAWKSAQASNGVENTPSETVEEEQVIRQTAYEQAREQAQVEIENFITEKLSWYDFQKLVGDLLIAMGYHIGHIAPPGPDGGIDITAYKDPLGTMTPRIRVQVKHRGEKAKVQEIRELQGLLKEGDVGMFVATGGFTKDAIDAVRTAAKHIEIIDLGRFIQFWQQYYGTVPESGKTQLPLRTLYFLAPEDES